MMRKQAATQDGLERQQKEKHEDGKKNHDWTQALDEKIKMKLQIWQHQDKMVNNTQEMQKISFFIQNNKITTDPRSSPPSLPYLIIGIEIEFLAHF
jgi:hypothetical protein